MEYELKDSGAREQFATGSVRDIQEGKGRFDLLPMNALWKLAIHFEKGCKKYGESNWAKGQPLKVYANSAMRHIAKWLMGWKDEDHLVAAGWNILCAIATREWILEGRLPAELDLVTIESTLKKKEEHEAVSNISWWFKKAGTTDLVSIPAGCMLDLRVDGELYEGRDVHSAARLGVIQCGQYNSAIVPAIHAAVAEAKP